MEASFGFAVQLLIAAGLGGVLGLEREAAGKPAGLRTILLICVGSSLLTQLSMMIPSSRSFGDPARIAAQIVSGIGFLGAGTIIQSRQAVHGLTSAAVIWTSAAVGMAVGAGYPWHAATATGIVLTVLVVLGKLESRVFGQVTVTLTVAYQAAAPDADELLVRAKLRRRVLRVRRERTPDNGGRLVIAWRGTGADANVVATTAETIPGLSVVGWEIDG